MNLTSFKKAIAIILTLALLITLIPPQSTNAQVVQTRQFQSGNAAITVDLQNQWETGYIAQIIIQNNGDKSIKNWSLEAEMTGTIDNVWNGKLTKEDQKGTVIISNADWNRTVGAGESTSVGIKVENATINEIFTIKLIQSKEQSQDEGYAIEYNIASQWENHAVIEAIIHNTGKTPLTDWNLTFQLNGEINNIWNAVIESKEENQYIINNQGYNAVIASDSTVTFGMEITYSDTPIEPPSKEILKSHNEQESNTEESPDLGKDPDGEEQPDIDWNDPTDSDKDGLPDVFEQHQYFTDIHKADTDGDGLKDGEEVEMRTDPTLPDTDEDGLTDGEEINTHQTNPLEEDTDKDGLPDGDEIVLGLNPLVPDTNGDGILDGEEYIPQTINKENIDSDLYENNDAVVSRIDLKAKGNINRNAYITEYEGSLAEEDPACIGKPILIEELEIESGTLQFTLAEEYEIIEYQIGGTRTNGLLICYNDGEGGDTQPLKTSCNFKAKTLTVPISENGIYFVVDAVELFNGLGINLEETGVITSKSRAAAKAVNDQTVQTVGMAEASVNSEDTIGAIEGSTVNSKADIIFVVDTTESMDHYINNVKYNLSAFVDELKTYNVAANFALIEFKDITADGKNSTSIKKNGNSCWSSNVAKFKKQIGALNIKGGGDYLETPIDALEKARKIKKHKTAEKHIILITDEAYKNDNSYGIKDMEEMIDLLKQDGITVSVVSHAFRKNDYKSLYQKTGGRFAAVDQNFKDNLLGIADNIGEESSEGYWIALEGLVPQVVRLNERPTRNGTADTDGDTLLDREELKSLTPTKHISTAPYLKALNIMAGGAGTKVYVYEYTSKPMEQDTDNDGIKDGKDNRPNKKGIYSSKEGRVVLGKMTLVSCCNNGSGHAFLVYQSYVKDTLDFRKFTGGYQYKTWEKKDPCKYKIKCSQYVAIGNAGRGIEGDSEIDETKKEVNDGDDAGVYFNREFANEHKKGKALYNLNHSYTREISQSQLKKVIKTCEVLNYFNISTNNCAKVAAKAWNKAYPNDTFYPHVAPAQLEDAIRRRMGSSQFDMAKEVPNIR